MIRTKGGWIQIMKMKTIVAVLASITVLAVAFSVSGETMTQEIFEQNIENAEMTEATENLTSNPEDLTSTPERVGAVLLGTDRTDIDTPDLDEKLLNKSTTVIYRLVDAGSGNLTIYWRYKTDVNGFQIRYSTDSTFTEDVHFAYYSGRNHATRYDLEVGKTWYVQVRTVMYNNGTRYKSNWSGIKSITLSRILDGTTLKNARGKEKGLSVSWNKNPAAQGYQLMYANNGDFLNAVTATVKGSDKGSFTKNSIDGTGSWYVRIRTWRIADNGEKYYSKWSEAAFVPAWK